MDEREFPKYFQTSIISLESGTGTQTDKQTNATHVPLVVPVIRSGFPPHRLTQNGRDRRRPLTALEELKRPLDNEAERAKTLRPDPVPRYHKRLFEEFFTIGPDLSKLEFPKNCTHAIVPPKTLYQFPNLPENRLWYLI